MPVIEKVAALLEYVTRADIESMPPAARERLAQQCQRIAAMAGRPAPRSGVLATLADGVRSD